MSAEVARASATTLVIGTATAALWLAGAEVGTPSVTSWDAAARWHAEVGSAVALAAVLRLAACALGSWLTVVGSLHVLAMTTQSAWARLAAIRIAPRSLQRLTHGLAGLSLSAGQTAIAPSAGTPHAAPPAVTIVRPADDVPPGLSTAEMHLVDAPRDGEPAAAATISTPTPVDIEPIAVVEPGDSLWSIAAGEVRDRTGKTDDATITRYWDEVVRANRAVLVDPANPDLIYPGQRIALPPG